MGARDEHARDASANAQLSALRNLMTRPMGVSSSLLSMLLSEPLLLEPLLVVILPELLLWFILFVRERCALELEVVRTTMMDSSFLIPTYHPTHAHTDRITEGAPKKFRRNRNRDFCEKSTTGAENTGILRIPAGITNLV